MDQIFGNRKDALKLAKEWTGRITNMNAPCAIIAEETAWGFQEVEKGRHPTAVLNDVIERINKRKTAAEKDDRIQ